jgi:HD superfamily phosphohydrolase
MTLLIIDRLANLNSLKEYSDLLKKVYKILSTKDQKQESNVNQIVCSLISSQLDVDRMDYLLRDSHFCGVDYGNYDRKWLLHGIQYCKKNNVSFVGINRKAIGVLEHYLMARRLMTNCVYKHPKVVASEHLLSCLIESVYENLEIFTSANEYKSQPLVRYLKKIHEKRGFEKALDDYINITDIDVEFIFKCLSSNDDHIDKPFKVLADRIFKREFPETYEIDYTCFEEAKLLIDEFKSQNDDIQPWQVKMDDRKIKTYKDANEKIFVIDRCENLKTIDHVSFPIFTMTNKNEVNPILIIDKKILELDSIKKLKSTLDNKGCFAIKGESLIR